MTKKQLSTYEAFVNAMSAKEKKAFEKEYKELVLSEMIIAAMEQDDISVRRLAHEAGVSPTIVQKMRTKGTKKNITMQSFIKVLNVLGCSLVIEKNGARFPINVSHM